MAPDFHDDFDAFDHDVWLPHYLPHWSSRAESAATWQVGDSVLRLSIPVDQGRWCPATHEPPLRVSGVQSGALSGQQPFLPDQEVVSPEPFWVGWAPRGGRIEVTARMDLTSRSMASVWMVGLEDEPDRCGEICLFEVFGRSISDGSAEVGSGVHPFRDPALRDDFEAPRLPIDVGDWHDYAADWHPNRVDFSIDGRTVRSVPQSPAYPMQIMIAVFDFPDWATPETADHVPTLEVDRVSGPASVLGTPT